MKDTIIKLFNLEPDDISTFEVVSTDYSIFVLITLKRRFQRCPNCGNTTKVVHDYRKRTIAHPVINGIEATIVFNQRRYRCTNCNHSFSEASPFSLHGRRISKYAVLRVMKMLKNPRITFSQVAEDTGLSKSSVIRIFDKYAGITPISMPTCLCIDEVYAIKYKQRVYACVLVDMLSNQIYDLLPTRKKSDLANYFSNIDIVERNKVQYVCIDMWEPYKQLALVYFPKAKICVDSFHVIQLINCAFTNIRLRVMKRCDRDSEDYLLLKHYSWLLFKNSSKIDRSKYIFLKRYFYCFDGRYVHPDLIINKLLSLSNDLSIAYSIKEEYAYWNKFATSENACKHVQGIIDQLLIADIPELTKVARTLKHWNKEIIDSFDRFQGRRISNGPVESVNSRIKIIKQNGNGYANFDRFRARVLYSLNKNSSIKL